MKKALSTICVYDRSADGRPIILSLTVIDCKGEAHCLIRDGYDHPYKHKCFAEMYCEVLSVCKSNGFRVPFIETFDGLCYNIEFTTMEKYSCNYAVPTRYYIGTSELQHYMLNIM